MKPLERECIKTEDVAKLRKLQEAVRVFDKIDLDALTQMADIDMNRRQAWSHFGSDSGNNVMLEAIKKIRRGIQTLKLCTAENELNRIEATIQKMKTSKRMEFVHEN